jgi:toxin HigB-1
MKGNALHKIVMIASYRHKGLKELAENGTSKKVRPDLHKRARIRLFALMAATDMKQLSQPGFDFHKLEGKPLRYSIHVNGPWCITFRWDGGNATEVDLVNYH